jgi:hypothetical protein
MHALFPLGFPFIHNRVQIPLSQVHFTFFPSSFADFTFFPHKFRWVEENHAGREACRCRYRRHQGGGW